MSCIRGMSISLSAVLEFAQCHASGSTDSICQGSQRKSPYSFSISICLWVLHKCDQMHTSSSQGPGIQSCAAVRPEGKALGIQSCAAVRPECKALGIQSCAAVRPEGKALCIQSNAAVRPEGKALDIQSCAAVRPEGKAQS